MSKLSSLRRFTDKQGLCIAFIHTYALLHGRPPAEADMQQYFGVTPPTVHRRVVALERHGLILRRRGKRAASSSSPLPRNFRPYTPIKTSLARYYVRP